MKRLHLAGRDRRALIAGATAVALLFGISRAVPASLAWQREMRAEDVEVREALDRSRVLVARADQARESSLVRGRRVMAMAPAILSGDSPNAAGATLAGLLSGAAALNNVRLGAIQLRGDTLAHAAFTTIGAHVVGTGDIRGIAGMLTALERGPTLLALRTVAITQPDPTAGDDRIEALHVEIDVEGLMLNPRGAK